MIPTLNPVSAGGGLPFEEFVALAARHGFLGVEFSIAQVADLGFERASAVLEGNKILPASFGLPVEWRKDEDSFREGLAALPMLAKLAQDLDCSRCCTWVLPDSGEPVREYSGKAIPRFVEIAKVLADNGIRLGLEFIGPKHLRPNPDNVWFYTIPDALRVADEINSLADTANVGLLVDSWHWHTSEAAAMDLAAIPLEQIVHVHVNDAPAGVATADLVDSVRELPGATGVIDIQAFLSTLNALGYDGPVAVETFSKSLSELPSEEAALKSGDALLQVLRNAGIRLLPLL